MKKTLVVLARIALGAVFIVAAAPKIADPPSFAHMISNYGLLPGSAVNALALFLPWLEMLTGLTLITGWFGRTGSRIAAGLLFVFILAIGSNLARGHAVQCGCFDVHAAEKSHVARIGEMRWVLVRDAALLGLAACLGWIHEDRNIRAKFLRKSAREET
jgi:uncharacterized membrane protein YphA (DoxX/SURF4 family)